MMRNVERLNQEAAKSIKYGGMSEEEALKMVTINPAKMLHVDSKVGSIKVFINNLFIVKTFIFTFKFFIWIYS